MTCGNRHFLPTPLFFVSLLTAMMAAGPSMAVPKASPPVPERPVATTSSYRLHGVNFGPYIRPDEDPGRGDRQISRQELRERLGPLRSRAEWVRTYGCNADLRAVGNLAHRRGLSAAVGAWLGSDDAENRKQIDCLLEEARAGNVDVAIVGSEVLLRGDLEEEELLAFIAEVRRSFAATRLDIPVTTAETHTVLLRHPEVLDAVDLIFVNYYPYWQGYPIDRAIAHLHLWHQVMLEAAADKEVIVSETGWPSCGDRVGEAVPSPRNAAFYFQNFVSWARANSVKYFIFAAYDEPWKSRHEGAQGACWGIWDRRMSLKKGMRAVFNGGTLPDNWSDVLLTETVIDFTALPELVMTNISAFLVASFADPHDQVRINGSDVPADRRDSQGNFAIAVSLLDGDNVIELLVEDTSGDVVSRTTKTVVYDPAFSTSDRRLLYVDVVDLLNGSELDRPILDGTVVIDIDQNAVLGIIENRHVRGIAPRGLEIYTQDNTVLGTDFHAGLRTLPFSRDLTSNGFAVSPDGSRLYAGDEIALIATNEIAPERLPRSIETVGSWAGAPIPGDPTISPDGRFLYCCSDLARIDTETYQVVAQRGGSIDFETDLALTADGETILLTDYSFASGRLKAYDAADPTILLHSISGLGDFAGEIALSASDPFAVVGSAGNANSQTDGRLSVIDLDTWQIIHQERIPLADNLATSGADEFFVASGESGSFPRLGVQMFVLEPSGTLARTKTFFLGINRHDPATGKPRNDRIRKIVFKPAITSVIFHDGFETGDMSEWAIAVIEELYHQPLLRSTP